MNASRGFLSFTLALLSVVALAAPAAAQATFGDLTGRVTDAQKSAVPGAAVTVRNEGTGLTRTTTSGDQGDYTLTQLPPGSYTVTAELSGFKKSIVREMQVVVGTRATLNFELEVGTLEEAVDVVASAALIETTRSDLSGVVTEEEVASLPMLNRTFAGLSIIMPEARPVGNFDPTKTRIGNFAMSGGDGRQLDVNVDGGDNKDNVVGSLIQNFAYESIQEFEVLQHRWTAESGRSVGGVVNVITKSGTNQLRGSAFGSYRGDNTRKMDFFELQRKAADNTFEKADFTRQEFGGSIGGPIARDEVFFFGAIERFRERSQNVVTQSAFTQLNAIPGASVLSTIPTPYDDTLLTVKADWQMGAGQRLFGRLAYQDQSSPNDQIPVPATSDLNNGNTNTTRNYDFVAGHQASLGSSRLNQFNFHFQNFTNEILPNVTDVAFLDFPSVDSSPNANTPQQTTSTKYQFRNDFSQLSGAHSLKFGTNYIYTQLGGYFYFGASGYTVRWFDDP